MTMRPCLDCGEPTIAARCTSCEARRQTRIDTERGTPTERGYDSRWQKLSRAARRLQPWCTDCGTSDDLTTDHLRWPARTLDDVDVVCRPCNSRRGPVRTLRPRGQPLGSRPRPQRPRGDTPRRDPSYPTPRQSFGHTSGSS